MMHVQSRGLSLSFKYGLFRNTFLRWAAAVGTGKRVSSCYVCLTHLRYPELYRGERSFETGTGLIDIEFNPRIVLRFHNL